MRVSVSEHERVGKLVSLSRCVLLSSMCESATTAPVPPLFYARGTPHKHTPSPPTFRQMQECDIGRNCATHTQMHCVCVISSTVRIREIATVWGEKYVSFDVCLPVAD